MRIMTVYAHPADTITNCGGTLALHADAGDEIVAVILTHGGRIHPNVYAEEARKKDADPALVAAGRAEIIENKKGELRRAADIIGIGTIEFLDHDDAISVVREDMVDQVAELIAKHRPDVIIADYPQNPVVTNSAHTIATMTLIAALDRAAQFLKNLDGREEVNVKQVFLGGLPVLTNDALSTYGVRNDLLIDITSVVGRKIAAMDCFVSQGYGGPFARKLIEASNGEFGRWAGVALAEPYVRFRSETRALLPVTEYAEAADPLTRHVTYSQFDVRREFPLA
ncbi:PIG-L deacetylase family protein [Microbacterium sp. MC2]